MEIFPTLNMSIELKKNTKVSDVCPTPGVTEIKQFQQLGRYANTLAQWNYPTLFETSWKWLKCKTKTIFPKPPDIYPDFKIFKIFFLISIFLIAERNIGQSSQHSNQIILSRGQRVFRVKSQATETSATNQTFNSFMRKK